MSESFRRCRYVPQDTGIECEVWFSSSTADVIELSNASDDRQYLCMLHRDVVSVDLAANGINKLPYISKYNERVALVHKMTDAELDAHIASIEAVIADQKMFALVGRAEKRQRDENLTDEEREQRRKIKTPREPKEAKKKSSVTLASNPLRYMMEKNGLSRENAISILGLDENEVKMYESI